MKNMFKDAIILFIITLIAGAALGFVYNITKEPIAQAEAKALEDAYKEVFAAADHFEELDSFQNPKEGAVGEWIDNGFENVDVNTALKAMDSTGQFLGYVIKLTTHEGYGGDIVFTMGITGDGTINGISILSISETAGLGMRAEEVLKPQYADKKTTAFTVTKTGATSESQIDAISGATITSNALTNAVNGGLYYFETALGGGMNEG